MILFNITIYYTLVFFPSYYYLDCLCKGKQLSLVPIFYCNYIHWQ
jgi:hypothetical protein